MKKFFAAIAIATVFASCGDSAKTDAPAEAPKAPEAPVEAPKAPETPAEPAKDTTKKTEAPAKDTTTKKP